MLASISKWYRAIDLSVCECVSCCAFQGFKDDGRSSATEEPSGVTAVSNTATTENFPSPFGSVVPRTSFVIYDRG